MADMDVFGDPELFAEFDKPREPSDRLLLETLKVSKSDVSSVSASKVAVGEGNDVNSHAQFILGSSDEESGEGESDSENFEEYGSNNGNLSTKQLTSEKVATDENGTSKFLKNSGDVLGDNKCFAFSATSDLLREIERLKKESILLVLWMNAPLRQRGLPLYASLYYVSYAGGGFTFGQIGLPFCHWLRVGRVV